MFRQLRHWFCPDLAIDLGTANTLIAVQGKGVVLDEPSVVALEKGSRRVLGRGTAVGKLARQMLGKTPDSITACRPLKDGVITDFELCEAMLKYFIQKVRQRGGGWRPRVLVAVPGGITPVERRAVFNSAERAGAGQVFLLQESKAAGIGAGLPISEPLASMICDIGGGTTEVAIFSLGGIVAGDSIRLGGDEFDEAIVQYLRQHFSLKIGMRTAEQLKIKIGSAWPLEQELTCEVSGLDLVSRAPRKSIITSEEVREALQEPLDEVMNCIRGVIERCDPELIADLADTGIILSGGSALLRRLPMLMQEQLGIPVRVTRDPLTTVARGAAICLDHLPLWRDSLDTGM